MVRLIRALRMCLSFVVGCSLLLPRTAIATDPSGVVSNVMLGQGVTTDPVHEPIRQGDSWSVNLDVSAPSDSISKTLSWHLEAAPAGTVTPAC